MQNVIRLDDSVAIVQCIVWLDNRDVIQSVVGYVNNVSFLAIAYVVCNYDLGIVDLMYWI